MCALFYNQMAIMANSNFLGDFKVEPPLHWFLLSGHYLVWEREKRWSQTESQWNQWKPWWRGISVSCATTSPDCIIDTRLTQEYLKVALSIREIWMASTELSAWQLQVVSISQGAKDKAISCKISVNCLPSGYLLWCLDILMCWPVG